MFKSTIAKWAIAAALAVPAVPLMGRTVHHRLVTPAARTHRTLIVKHHHRLVTRHHRSLTAHRKLTTRHHRLVRKTGLRRSEMSTTPAFKVHVTKMPPTIDGINT